MKHLMHRKMNVYLIWGILTIVYFIGFALFVKFDDIAITTGDDHEYQMLAQNYAEGKGIMVDGIYGGSSRYKLDFTNNKQVEVLNTKKEITYNFYRTPGYPIFFLGHVYKIVGSSPYRGKMAALFLLCLVAAGLPFICFIQWGPNYIPLGIIASFIQIETSYQWAERLAAEPVLVFAIFTMTICFLLFDKKKKLVWALLLGVSMAFGLLVKGIMIFFPCIVFAYYFISFFKKKTSFTHLFCMISVFVILISCWAFYATSKSDKLVILSTQGSIALFDGNNEYSQGSWERQWIDHKDSFYNTDGMSDKPALLRVANFYKHHPILLPILTFKKIIVAYVPQLFLCLILFVWFFRAVIEKIDKLRSIRVLQIFFFTILIAFSVFHIYTINSGDFLWQMYYLVTSHKSIIVPLALLILIYITLIKKHIKEFTAEVPTFFWIATLNSFLTTIVMYGYFRFVNVMNFLFIIFFLKTMQTYLETVKLKYLSIK